MAKFWAWYDQPQEGKTGLSTALANVAPGEIAVIDWRPAGAVSNVNINNGQRFTSYNQLKNAVSLDITNGPSLVSSGGTWNEAKAGDWVWEIRAFVVHTTASIMWAYFIEENGDYHNGELVVVESYDGAPANHPDLLMKPDYGPTRQHTGFWQHKGAADAKEFNFAFSSGGGFIGAGNKGPFSLWPLIPAVPQSGECTGTQGVHYCGAWGGTKYDEASPVFVRVKKSGGTPGPGPGPGPSPIGGGREEFYLNGELVGWQPIYAPASVSGNNYVRFVDENGNELGRQLIETQPTN